MNRVHDNNINCWLLVEFFKNGNWQWRQAAAKTKALKCETNSNKMKWKWKISFNMYRMNIWRVICFTKWLQLLIRSNQHSKLQSECSFGMKFKRRETNCSKYFSKINEKKKRSNNGKVSFFSVDIATVWWRHYLHTKHEIHASRSQTYTRT